MNTPAGWYTDPDNPYRQRYWDGQQWTENYSETTAPVPPLQPAAAYSTSTGGYIGGWPRIFARILDAIVLSILGGIIMMLGVLGAVGVNIEDNPGDKRINAAAAGIVAAIIIFFAATFLYEVFCIALWGQTIGKRLMHIKIVKANDFSTPGWVPAIIRWLIPGAISIIPLLGGLIVFAATLVSLAWLFSDPRFQTISDKAANTVAIRV